MFNLFVNWEKTGSTVKNQVQTKTHIQKSKFECIEQIQCPNLSLTIENNMGKLHKIRLMTFQTFKPQLNVMN